MSRSAVGLPFQPVWLVLAVVAAGACGDNVVAPPETLVLPSQAVSTAYNFVGNDHACALTIDGEAYCWGQNQHGQLGTGTRESSTIPVRVATTVRFQSIAVGGAFACATTSTGAAYCWGSLPRATTNEVDPLVPAPLDTELRFAQLTAGDNHACGLTLDGSVFCWGGPIHSTLGDGSTRQSRVPVRVPINERVVSISTSWELNCALTEDGVAYCWGFVYPTDLVQLVGDAPVPVAEGFRFEQLSTHGADFCGITPETDLYCWFGSDGGPPHEAAPTFLGRGFVKMSAGQPFCAIRSSGDATCWTVPRDFRFSFDQTSPTLSVSALNSFSFLSISGSLGWTCGVVRAGPEGAGVYCWGSNRWGQLGNGSTTPSSSPKRTLMPRR